MAAAALLAMAGSAGRAEELSLAATIAAAPGGEANGHVFAHLVALDAANTYTGGALVQDDTCIHGNGATIDLDGGCIVVLVGSGATRFDIDHALVLNGAIPSYAEYGGAIEFGTGTQGWVIQNTFFNSAIGIYLHEVDLAPEAVRIRYNILYRNGQAGIVIHDTQLGHLEIQYNDCHLHMMDYAMHCGCGSEAFVEVEPGVIPPEGETPAFDNTNFSAYPEFVHDPADPHGGPPDYHLTEESPCINAGPLGEDLGAFPFDDSPVVPTTWGALKALFRE